MPLTCVPALPSPPVVFQDGPRKIKLEPTVSGQQRGWGPGEHYYLPVDSNNKAVPEPGEIHRKVHVTANTTTQWTAARIGTAEGISAATVTASWLAAQTKYGTQTHPLEPLLGRSLFDHLVWSNRRGSSHWFLLERSYTYPSTLNISPPTTCQGESPLHPLVFGAWGTGAPPVCEGRVAKISRPTANIMWKDLTILGGESNVHDTFVFNESVTYSREVGPDSQSGRATITYRNCRFFDVHHAVPVKNMTDWKAAADNRIGCFYSGGVDHLLLDACHWSMGGWQEGYDPNNGPGPQPPSMYSHNIYLQNDTFDATCRDGLSERGASMAYMMRGGVQMYDCVAMDSGIGMQSLGGVNDGAANIGNFSLFLGGLIHLAAVHHPVAQIGARAWARSQGAQASWVDNIIAHAIDPNNPAEIARKTAIMPQGHEEYFLLSGGGPYFRLDYDNSVIANWGGRPESNVTVSQAQAAAVTAVNWYRQKSGNAAATLADFYAYVRTRPAREVVHELLAFFRQGFNAFHKPARTAATTATFKPDPRADGFRWDNRLNWSTGDIPGAVHAGDQVNLHGNNVRFGNHPAQLASLALSGGILDVVSGRLTVTAITGSGTIMVRRCGQLVTDQDSMAGKPVGISGGRIAYRAPVLSDDVTAYGRSQVLLGPDFTLPAGKTLAVEGGLPKVGWDGSGAAVLRLNGTLRLRAAPVLVATVYNSGGNNVWNYSLEGQTVTRPGGSAVVAGMLRATDERRELTLHGWTAVPAVGAVVDVDTVTTITATMPTIRRFRSGMNGAVDPTVALSGPLHLDLTTIAAGTYPLIDAAITGSFSGLTIDNLNPSLDATVTVTPKGVKLTLAPGSGRSALA